MSDSHEVEYRRKLVYKSHFDASFVVDGKLKNDARADGEDSKVLSEVYECECGKTFLKGSTVAAHLESVKGGQDD